MRLALLGLTGIVWALMMAVLFNREVLPYFEYHASPSYRTLLKEKPSHELTRKVLYLGSQRAGESILVVYPGSRGCTFISSNFSLSLKGLERLRGLDRLEGLETTITMRSTVRVDPNFELEWLQAEGRMLWPVEIKAERVAQRLRTAVRFAGREHREEVELPPNALMASDFLPLASVGRPREGKKWRFQLIQPDLGGVKFVTVYAQIMEKEPKLYKGKVIPLFRVEVRKDPAKELAMYRMWVDDEGEVLIEEMTLLTMPYTAVLEEKRTITPAELHKILQTR